MARPLLGLATLYARQNQYGSAETLYKRAIAILEDSLDRDHPRMASALQGLASVYDARGGYAAAEALLKRALVIRVKALGEGHPDVAVTRDLLAKLRSEKPVK